MAAQDEVAEQSSPTERSNEQLEDNLHIDLDFHLLGVKSDESEPNTGSTIYDPGVLAMSSDFRAIVEGRQDREEDIQSQDQQNALPFHIPSPAARKPWEMGILEARIRPPEETEEESEQEQKERELCCHGFLPLFQSMIAFNMINVVIGITCVVLSTSALSNGNKDVVGFESAERLVISGSFLLAVFSVVLGSVLVLSGFLGALANYAISYRSSKSGKIPNLVYHCFLFLVTLICIIVLGLNVYSVTVRQNGPIYDIELWKEFVRSDSRHLCNLEQKFNCAGMSLGQCVSNSNATRYTYCPGHFCVDFCRIATDDVSLQPICSSCLEDPLESIPLFLECRTLEKQRSEVQNCKGLPDEDLDKTYGKLLIIAVIGFVWILLVWSVIAYVECFL